jgi:hypothetical protein
VEELVRLWATGTDDLPLCLFFGGDRLGSRSGNRALNSIITRWNWIGLTVDAKGNIVLDPTLFWIYDLSSGNYVTSVDRMLARHRSPAATPARISELQIGQPFYILCVG